MFILIVNLVSYLVSLGLQISEAPPPSSAAFQVSHLETEINEHIQLMLQ